MSCLVRNFGLLTNGAFSVCFRRGVVGGGAPAMPQEEVKPQIRVKSVDYKLKGKDEEPIIIIKEIEVR
jgi:hypothetical protein